MSNSIWKTGYPKYEHDRSWDDIIQEYRREDGSKFYIVGDCSEPNDRWTYLTDIIAQADKAERLQKGLEDIKNQLEYRACLECKHCNQQLNAIEILKDVEPLIKGE